MAEKWEEIRDALVSSVEDRAKDFLKDNKAAKDFLVERAERLAKLAVAYAMLDGVEKDQAKADMAVVAQSIENQVAALSVTAASGTKKLFANLVGVAFDSLVKALPALIGAL